MDKTNEKGNRKKFAKSARFKKIIKVFLDYNVLQNLSRQENPEQIRAAFEELGPTFIKIGQMLSVRSDIFPPSFTEVFKKLQDDVKADEFAVVKDTIESETQLSLDDLFETFEEQPFASASMGQTHKAVLLNGQTVAVKIQHPNIKERISLDLSLLEKALPFMKYIPEAAVIDPKEVFLEIKQSLDMELDTLQEAENAQEFYENNNNWETLRVPFIYKEYCTGKMLVMEYMEGDSIKEFIGASEEDDKQKKIKKSLGDLLVRNFVKQVFEDGFFHADPHPGNILVQEDKAESNTRSFEKKWGKTEINASFETKNTAAKYKLVYLDFGMMGRLSNEMIQKLTAVMDSLYGNNSRAIGRAVLQLCKQTGPLDEADFYDQLAPLLDKNYGIGIGEINLQTLFFQIIDICHKNNLQVPQEVTMLIKAVATFEGMIRELDPEISLVEIATPFAKKYFTEKVDWSFELKRAGLDLLYSARAMPKIPSKTLDVLDEVAKGKAKINFELKKQDEVINRLEKMINRLVIGLVLSAVIIGSSMLVKFNGETTAEFVSILGIAGYSLALFTVLYLIYDSWRKRRK